jgi:RNA polymerase sigma-70 factor (sigma-E family)
VEASTGPVSTGPASTGPASTEPNGAGPNGAGPNGAGPAGTGLTQQELAKQEPAEDGFAQFVAARERALLRTAWLLTGDWALAEDLVQTALVRSWPRWERIRRREHPEVYVRRVMVNTWASWARRRWRGERPAMTMPDEPAPGDIAGEVTLRMVVRAALGSLTRRQRAVVVLRVFDDMSEAQVADVLGCSVGTVKSTLSRALARLRESLPAADLVEWETR